MIDINLLKSIPFFESFPEDILEMVADLCENRDYKAKEVILQQGDINLDLYFLVDGTVAVFVDNKSIVSVSGDGEIFGEMSLAAQSPCTATVASKTNCQFVILNFNKIKSLAEQQRDVILRYCWHSIAENLSKKLVITNEIAKTYRLKYKQASEES